ncbi:purine and uridine phosphorylase [Thozetella sp. PMI_491]|nr:purine and uridine phosphorylase [Thozetella sp. PMI_491]
MTQAAPTSRSDFRIAIICALPLEYDAVSLVFDEFWDSEEDRYGKAPGDPNQYTTGRIGRNHVVLVLLPGMGISNAANGAAGLRSSYHALRLTLLVGVCGGVPSSEHEILLGDVIISKSIIQHDFGKRYPDQFRRKTAVKDSLGKANKEILGLLAIFETHLGRERLEDRTSILLREAQSKAAQNNRRRAKRYIYPGVALDQLFEPTYRHKHHGQVVCICRVCHEEADPVCDAALASSCDELRCDRNHLVTREALKDALELAQSSTGVGQKPTVHVGTVASGDSVMKSAAHRDRIAQQDEVIGFEMEGAGVWDDAPCLLIKGVCDYADSHKQKYWQDYAAATAAAATKAVLERYIQTDQASNTAASSGKYSRPRQP